MPRQARKKGNTGCYHVLLTSVAQREMFIIDKDYSKFKEILNELSIENEVKLCAYSLLKDHTHALIYFPNNKPGPFMKKLTTRYAFYLNGRTGEKGALFYDRYRSCPVDTVGEYRNTIVGIHTAPVELNLVKQIADYPYSSYSDYTNDNDDSIISKEITDAMMNEQQFETIHKGKADKNFMRVSFHRGFISDEQAQKDVYDVCKVRDILPSEIVREDKKHDCVAELVKRRLSVRQINQYTGWKTSYITKVYHEVHY